MPYIYSRGKFPEGRFKRAIKRIFSFFKRNKKEISFVLLIILSLIIFLFSFIYKDKETNKLYFENHKLITFL